MTMISGSHKLKIQKHEDTYAENNILTRGQAIKSVDKSKAVDLILRPTTQGKNILNEIDI